MRYSIYIIIVTLFSTNAFATVKTKMHMQSIFSSYAKLLKSVNQEDIKDQKKVEKELLKLEQVLLKTRDDAFLNSPILAPTRDMIIDSIDNIKDSHKQKSNHFTKYRVKTVLSTCIACHSQLPAKTFKPINANKTILSSAGLTEFEDKLQVTLLFRDYQKSLYLIDRQISHEIIKHDNDNKIEALLAKIIETYLANLQDPKGLKTYLNTFRLKYKTGLQIQEFTSNQLKMLKKLAQFDLKDSSSKNIALLIKRLLAPNEESFELYDSSSDLISQNIMKGILAEYIIKNPEDKLIPTALFWKGIIENQNRTLYLYSLGDAFLKKCVTKYPKHEVAKKCYNAYKESIEFGFTGSAGTNIPVNVKKSLTKLKALL